jgi:hypothetical protein
MARVIYNANELDPHDRGINAITETLRGSDSGRAVTTLPAIDEFEMVDGEGNTIDAGRAEKIEYVCRTLQCTHEVAEDKDQIVFLRSQSETFG